MSKREAHMISQSFKYSRKKDGWSPEAMECACTRKRVVIPAVATCRARVPGAGAARAARAAVYAAGARWCPLRQTEMERSRTHLAASSSVPVPSSF